MWGIRGPGRARPLGAAALGLVLLAAACSATTTNAGAPGTTSASSGSASGTVAPPPDPSVRGPQPVGYLELTVTDPARNRTLPVSVWFPADHAGGQPASYAVVGSLSVPARDVWTDVPVASGRHPLVVFSHGSTGTRFQSWFLTETLASHGFVVVAPDHPGNTLGDKSDLAALTQAAMDRPKDVRVLLDDVLARAARPAPTDNPLGGAIDPDRIGMSGHSYGGYTTLTAVGGSGYGDPPDPRIKAAAPLAPAASIIPEANLRAVSVPLLLMGGSLDTTTPPDSQVLRTYDLVASPNKTRAVLDGGNHNSFTIACGAQEYLDAPGFPEELRALAKQYLGSSCGPGVMPYDRAASIIDRYVVAFFLWQLTGDERYGAFLSPVDGVQFASSNR